ncbi:MAG: heme-binding protein [Candidatus Margulisiibacteriota bacterium]
MKISETVTLIAGSFLVVWLGYGFIFESNIEQPNYDIVKKSKDYEIRFYPKLRLITSPMSNQSNTFQSLFRYIDGQNQTKTKISMTAPVIEYQETMSFVFPSSIDNPPKAMNNSLEINTIPGLKVAVKKFSGSTKNHQRMVDHFRKELINNGINVSQTYYLAQYNSPWVFPLLRKNEIWIEVNE